MGTPGWIHTSYDNSTSTATLNWVEVEDLENHIKVAALTVMRISPNACIIVRDDYSTIQGAINAADANGTVYVRKGTYYENVVVNKTIMLIGESKENTIVDGGGIAAVIRVESDSVLVTGFTVQNSSWGWYYYEGSGITLEGARYCNVRDNIAINVRYGVSSWLGWNNSISGNTMSNVEQGVSFDGPVYHNNITSNLISDTYFGIMLWETSYYTTIVDNTITNSSYAGIYFDNGTGALVVGNILSNNYHGIDLFQSNESKIYHNNFINNTQQALLSSSFNTTWDDGYPSGGNYWSNYTGLDFCNGPYQNVTGGDGIGDTPHIIDENNQDTYPLMKPWPTARAQIIQTTVTIEGKDYTVTVESNATITNATATRTALDFTSSGLTGQTAYVNVTLPVGLNKTEIKVFLDSSELVPPPFPTIASNGTHYFVYFEFTLSTHNITIQYAITDVATTNITLAKTVVGQGYTIRINATIENQGHYEENFHVTMYANLTFIASQAITLTSGNSTTLTFTWNTTGFAKGNYPISAYAWPVQDETDTGDNALTDGVVYVGVPGDVDANHKVEVKDILMLAKAYGTNPQSPNWNPNLDVNGDDKVDIKDILIAAKNYGKTDP
jgi:parallel beta-helix repeat protein